MFILPMIAVARAALSAVYNGAGESRIAKRRQWTDAEQEMPGKDMPEKDMTEKDKVLSANLEFYRAFTTRDANAMDRLWALALPVSCVHPGWMALRDREAVMRSWRDILANPEAPRIMCHDEDAVLYGDVAVVTCEEALDDNTLVATNIFARQDGSWLLVHHQAGPLLMRAGHGGTGANRLN